MFVFKEKAIPILKFARNVLVVAFMIQTIGFAQKTSHNLVAREVVNDTSDGSDSNEVSRFNHQLWGGLVIGFGFINLAMAGWYYYTWQKTNPEKCKIGCLIFSLVESAEESVEMEDLEAMSVEEPLAALAPISKSAKAYLIGRRLVTTVVLLGDALGIEVAAALIGGISNIMPENAQSGYEAASYITSTLALGLFFLSATGLFTPLDPQKKATRILNYIVIPSAEVVAAAFSFFAAAVLFDASRYASENVEESNLESSTVSS